jgi:hypothetical protein
MKKIAAVLFLLAAVGPAFAQVGGNDWKDTGIS